MAGPQGEAAYQQSQSPTQTPAAFSTGRPQPHQSPNAVSLPHQHANHHPHSHSHSHSHSHPPHPPPPPPPPPPPLPHAHQHHHSPTTSAATELPPISTAIYSRDRNTYYDPTQDNGPVGRDAAAHSSHYPPPVCTPWSFLQSSRLLCKLQRVRIRT